MNATHCLTLCVFAVCAHLGKGRSASNMVAQEPSVFGFGLLFALEMRFLPRTYGRQLTLGWLAIRPQEFACLCSPAPGVQSMLPHQAFHTTRSLKLRALCFPD